MSNAQWPEGFGFGIAGSGPCYVIWVERGGMAHNAGIVPGDQLLEVDGHNVTECSADAVKTFARHSQSVPPSVGVVSKLQYVELLSSQRWGFGLSLHGTRPTIVDAVDPPGPAYQAGIRPGDYVLEINGRKVRTLSVLQSVLSTRHGRLTLAIIPRENKNAARMDGQDRRTDGSRVRKARDLFAKMNLVLGGDYERKMAIVGLMKQYAEDRNVENFAGGVSLVLTSSEHKKLIRELRPFVPVKQRSQFDKILHHDPLGPLADSASTAGSARTPLIPGQQQQIRDVTIARENGSFGFILRGHAPVYIESITVGSPADRAGLAPGDAILKLNGLDVSRSSHTHVIKLLKGSGSTPRLQIRKLTEENGVGGGYASSNISSDSSSASKASSDWMAEDSSYSHLVDTSGRTFRDRVDHLLTDKEQTRLQKALINYNVVRNVSQLVDDLSPILDSPSKQTLWTYVLPRMSKEHRQYVLRYVDMPKHQLQDLLAGSMPQDTSLQRGTHIHRDRPSTGVVSPETADNWDRGASSESRLGSFRKQLDYLLTARERSQLKRALQIYAQKRNARHLLEDLSSILDTPSKRTLWFFIIPLLSTPHQRYCQQQLGLPQHVIRSTAPARTSGHGNGYHHNSSTLPQIDDEAASPRKGDVIFQEEFNSIDRTRSSPRYTAQEDRRHDRLQAEVNSASDMRARRQGGGVQWHDRTVINRNRSWEDGEQFTMTLNPTYVDTRGLEILRSSNQRHDHGQGQGHMREMSVQTSPTSSMRDNAYRSRLSPNYHGNPSLDPGHPGHGNNHYLSRHSHYDDNPSPHTSHGLDYRTVVKIYNDPVEDPHLHSVPPGGHGATRMPGVGKDSSADPDLRRVDGQSSDVHNGPPLYATVNHVGRVPTSDADSDSLKNSSASLDSYQTRAMNAIRALDEVVENEADFDSSSNNTAPPLPPPPPPAPPPPPDGINSITPSATSMRVKRMNWEKIDVIDENSVWAKLGDSDDLDDIVKYLELEQQFSTKKNKISQEDIDAESFRERKNEISILSPKKAYNISILLGHLRRPVYDFKQSLYGMDEEVLTAELLRQLLAYAPDEKELEKYEKYKNSTELLSKPDQFMYHLSRVPGYLERMKAMLFKANFAEKVDEVRNALQAVQKASRELQRSKKLEKILELVLAMGNYLNKGNARVGSAVGFKIAFLTQLESTKTSDNKGTFLNVLADAVNSRFPECLQISQDLNCVHEAAKVSSEVIAQELSELRKVLQDISTTVNKLGAQKPRIGTSDKFYDDMGHFISEASDELQRLFSLHTTAMQEFEAMLQYFGEERKNQDTNEIFSVFSDFINKFEKAHLQNRQQRRQYSRDHTRSTNNRGQQSR